MEWSINTLNRKLACFRKFGKHQGFPQFLSGYKKIPKPPAVAHPIPEGIEGLLAMYKAARKSTHKSLVVLIGFCGLRNHEALAVRPSHINEADMEIRVIGKGSKTRSVPISDKVYQMLLPRLVECWATNERLVPLHERTARRAWTSMGNRAGLAAPTSTHDGRMTFGTTAYYNSGGDIRAVQDLLGHASSKTTEDYTFVSMEKMRAAADLLGEDDASG